MIEKLPEPNPYVSHSIGGIDFRDIISKINQIIDILNKKEQSEAKQESA